MSTYQDEIFNYLTKKDNFFSAFEIHQLFPVVKNKLIEQFWLGVKGSLEELAKECDWQIDISDNIFEPSSHLTVWLDDSFAVAFEELHGQTYYGLWVDFDNKKLDRPRIDNYATGIEAINWMKKSTWYLGWTFTGANFENIETLKKILPDNKNDYAIELANQLFELCNDLKNHIWEMSKITNEANLSLKT